MKQYNVWIGGGEVNSIPLSLSQAQSLAQDYIEDGYDDVIIEQVEEE
jgi:hypothetical protein